MSYKILIFTLAMICFLGSSVFACTCGSIQTVGEARTKASMVFLGKAVDAKYEKSAVFLSGKDAGEELTFRFKVERWWKGGAAPDVVLFAEVYKATDGTISVSSCVPQYDLGTRYLVYGRLAEDGKLRTTLCSRTAKVEVAKSDLEELGKGETPKKKKILRRTKKT